MIFIWYRVLHTYVSVASVQIFCSYLSQKESKTINIWKHLVKNYLPERKGGGYCTCFYGFNNYDQHFHIWYTVWMSIIIHFSDWQITFFDIFHNRLSKFNLDKLQLLINVYKNKHVNCKILKNYQKIWNVWYFLEGCEKIECTFFAYFCRKSIRFFFIKQLSSDF